LEVYRNSGSGADVVFRILSDKFGTRTQSLYIEAGGDIYNASNAFGQVGDIRLKENIHPARAYLEDICKLEIVNFTFKTNPDNKQLDVIAQQTQEIFPRLVTERADGFLSVKYRIFSVMLIKCTQELSAKNTTLQSQVDAQSQILETQSQILETQNLKIDNLQKQIDDLKLLVTALATKYIYKNIYIFCL
jgi:hypothetical protein